MPDQIDEIKAKVDIVDLISEYIRLKQAGTNWKALCPFHNEKTPSFMVSRDRQIWHCFGCGEGGDIFSFIQKIEGLEFPEALRLLAQKAGVKLVSQDPQLTSQKNRLLDVTQMAANFWHKTLLDSKQAQPARDYLKKRAVSDQTITDFKLGYAVDSWDTLINLLKNKGFRDNEIFLAGLSVKKERGENFYDRFRDRLIFPINDVHGNEVGFSGRTLKPDEKEAKYINTPQTLIYNKSLVLYNLDKAKTEIKKQNLAIVVEGQMDVLSSVQAGVNNVIASSGTAFTLDQIRILKRYTTNIAIAFDTDLAGESAAKRGIDVALGQEMNVRIITLPHGKDPDECIKNNPSDWTNAIKQAKSIMDYYFDQTKSRLDLTQVDGKKEAAKILLGIIAKIGNRIEQTHWLQKLSDLIQVPEDILRERLPRPKQVYDSKVAENDTAKAEPLKSKKLMLSERILALVLKFPQFLSQLIDELEVEIMTKEEPNELYKELIVYYTEDIGNSFDNFDYNNFKAKIKSAKLAQLADTLVLLAEKDFFDFDQETIRQELTKMVNFLKRDYYAGQLKELEAKIKKAEEDNLAPKEIEKLSWQFEKIIKRINLLD
ncbi:MAG: DNA primase [Candidatus Buchananbacteria bacterium RIFCSPHIGHO2_01_FULL_39_8]|uniref:DNA primase n=1 Tax=Candidatus Buchananbacteria bacterium RIFCSPHIGHO2_01_FULL_39_8 TaxID=1797533 RepID=A0A1G1Y299_9BACT|nr:MAG: DNA primase [Candidatus Buchananbacteria bacterium RIFCSPHIGHO2_01_FULL_39_8]